MSRGLNMRKLRKAFRGMDINLNELDASEVIIRLRSGEEYLFRNPSVVMTKFSGQEIFQITGSYEIRTASAEEIKDEKREEEGQVFTPSEEDVKLVASQANVSEEKAREALIKTGGDLAEAISLLMEGEL